MRRLALTLPAVLCLPFWGVAQGVPKPLNRPYADLRAWRLGFAVGMHFQDLQLSHSGYAGPGGERWAASVPGVAPGFNVCVMGERRLGRYTSLRLSPGLMFGGKEVKFREHATGEMKSQDVKSTYVNVPLDLKLAGDRLRNVRPYLTVGAAANFDLGRRRADPLQFAKSDAMLTVGLGTDLYLPYFKLNPELKFCFGLTDILRHNRPDLEDDPAAAVLSRSLGKVKSRFVVLSFYFE